MDSHYDKWAAFSNNGSVAILAECNSSNHNLAWWRGRPKISFGYTQCSRLVSIIKASDILVYCTLFIVSCFQYYILCSHNVRSFKVVLKLTQFQCKCLISTTQNYEMKFVFKKTTPLIFVYRKICLENYYIRYIQYTYNVIICICSLHMCYVALRRKSSCKWLIIFRCYVITNNY